MSESFLHYLWKFQYFHKENLVTTEGEQLGIFSTGTYNSHSGPDFTNARIQVGDMLWVGNVEIHVRGVDWDSHDHSRDPAYENVVLHVVWSDSKLITRSDGSSIPTLELSERVSERLIFEYRKLINSFENIPCAQQLSGIPDIIRYAALDDALATRLRLRAEVVLQLLDRNKGDWEETCYQLLAKNFGFKVNSDPFFQLSHMITYRTLMKHRDKSEQVEALLFGAAGFLEDAGDDPYALLLQREFNILRQKYKLIERTLHKVQWKFLRLRPANFPTLRIAQFSALIHKRKHLFSTFLEADNIEFLQGIFINETSPYWTKHYHFKKTAKQVPTMGIDSLNNLILNTVVPLLAAYATSKDEYTYMERALDLLNRLPGEQNRIIREWGLLSFSSKSAHDSQALIELYNNFCSKRRCLDCSIGNHLLKSSV